MYTLGVVQPKANKDFYTLYSTGENYSVLDKVEHVDSENTIRIPLVRQK